MTQNWVPFEEGLYRVEEALIVAGESSQALALIDPLLEVTTDRRGIRHVLGRGKIRPSLLVELLEQSEALDLLLDLGGPYKYHLLQPEIKGGKVFSATVQSTVRFVPRQAWQELSELDYARQRSVLTLLPP